MWVYQEANGTIDIKMPKEGSEPDLLPTAASSLEQGKVLESNQSIRKESRTRTQGRGKKRRERWMLAGAFLFGSSCSGILQTFIRAQDIELLRYGAERWLELFYVSDATTAGALFWTEYMTLAIAASFLLLASFSALGPGMISFFMMIYGLGSGMLVLQLCMDAEWKQLLTLLLFAGVPAALSESWLCELGAAAIFESERLHQYVFHSWRRTTELQEPPRSKRILGRYALTLFLLLPLCGISTGLAYVRALG